MMMSFISSKYAMFPLKSSCNEQHSVVV